MLLALLGASMAVAVDRKVGCFCFGLGAKGRALNAVAGINGPGKSGFFLALTHFCESIKEYHGIW